MSVIKNIIFYVLNISVINIVNIEMEFNVLYYIIVFFGFYLLVKVLLINEKIKIGVNLVIEIIEIVKVLFFVIFIIYSNIVKF